MKKYNFLFLSSGRCGASHSKSSVLLSEYAVIWNTGYKCAFNRALMWLSLASFWTLTHSTTGQHLSNGLTFRKWPREKPLWPQNALCFTPPRWVWSQVWLVPGSTHSVGHLFLTILSHWQMESCTLAHLLISWDGTLLFSVPWETIIQSELSSMIQDGWMVK